jgi:BASS family bile acid:Na+ symporter
LLLFARLFPVWALLAALVALRAPRWFEPLGSYVTPPLALVMFAMGMTLTTADFRRVATRPGLVLAGVGLHYLIMPAAAWAISRVLALPPEIAAGMILVGSVASGTASTLMVFLSGGDVALSVSIGALSTCVGVVATPALTRLYVSTDIAVHGWAMLTSIVEVVAAPVLLGVLVNLVAGRAVRRIGAVLPLVSIAAILVIIGVVTAGARPRLASVGPAVLLGVLAPQRDRPARRLLGRPRDRIRRARLPDPGAGGRHAEFRPGRGTGADLHFSPGRAPGSAVFGMAQPVRLPARRILGKTPLVKRPA